MAKIEKEEALLLLQRARENAERNYKGERLKGVQAGLSIMERLISGMDEMPEEEAEEQT